MDSIVYGLSHFAPVECIHGMGMHREFCYFFGGYVWYALWFELFVFGLGLNHKAYHYTYGYYN